MKPVMSFLGKKYHAFILLFTYTDHVKLGQASRLCMRFWEEKWAEGGILRNTI